MSHVLQDGLNGQTENRLTITDIQQLSGGCIKVQSAGGVVFFIRALYLQKLTAERLRPETSLAFEETEDLIQAGLVFAAEKAAVRKLERSEQTRFMLTRKLAAKGYHIQTIDMALDYLEKENILSDRRFAEAWLHSRLAAKNEGKYRLAAELAARGVSREIIKDMLDQIFLDQSETDICIKAVKKYISRQKGHTAIIKTLCRKGFPQDLIKRCLTEVLSADGRQI